MPSPKLLDQVRTVARLKHFSLRTEQAYVSWIRRFILFHKKRHPAEMAEAEIRQFLANLAVEQKISASTQTVALSALLFLYRDVLKRELPYVEGIERAKPSKRLPVVFSRAEVQSVLAHLTGTYHLIASLLYGATNKSITRGPKGRQLIATPVRAWNTSATVLSAEGATVMRSL